MSSIYGLGNVTAPTATIAREVLDFLEANGTPLRPHPDTGVPVVWGYSPGAEHGTGRALDFMVTADTSVGDVIADYVWTHRDRFGLIHVIWRQRIRSTVVSPGVWRHMSDRGSPTENHMDHPHCYFDGRDVKAKATTTPPAKSTPQTQPSSKETLTVRLIDLRNAHLALVKGAGVRPLQRLLTVPADGLAGPRTRRALGAAQKRAGLPVDYIFGPKTAEALLAGKA